MLGLLLGAGLVVGGAFGARELKRYAMTSPTFGLAGVEIEGNHRVDAEEVMAIAELELGTNLFQLDLEGARARLEASDWIRSARLTRRLPDSLRIEVEEHRPVLIVAFGQLYYVDEMATPFRAFGPGDEVVLPMQTGLERKRYLAGEPETMRRLRLGVELVEAWQGAGEGAGELASLEIGPAGLARAIRADEVELVLGPPPYAQAIARAERALSAAHAEGLRPSRLVVGRDDEEVRVTMALEADRAGDERR